jgi:putative endonuclease
LQTQAEQLNLNSVVFLSAAKDLRLFLLSLRSRMFRRTMPCMRERSFFTYIMASRSHTLYIGATCDLQRRVFEHKWKEHDGFTARYNCDRLVWFERHGDVRNAIGREKILKGWLRKRKIALIESVNPAWVDLSREWYDCEPADYKRSTGGMQA